jgi:ribosome-associated heat shock protein Hsp15
MLKKVRIDKWLWSVRIFKSRTLAAEACRSGKVKIDEKSVKPAFMVERDMEVFVHKGGFNLHFKVIDLIQKRVAAPLAQQCYENLTTEEEMNKYKDWFIGKRSGEQREKGAGRPTKKERREIDEFKDDIYFDF